MGQFLYQYRYFIFLLIAGSHLLFGWPGILNPDSTGQYQEAIRGLYTDHHPPMMAFLWRYLDMIHQGPGLMFTFHMLLLYSSMWILLKSSEQLISFREHPFFLLGIFSIPLIPQVFLYSLEIVKDLSFSFSFLMTASILTYFTLNKKSLSWFALIAMTFFLIYGIGVKYQAQFCAPVLLIWMGLLWQRDQSKVRAWAQVFLIALVVYGGAKGIHKTLVPESRTSHSWEWVKLFDLASISISTNHDLIPNCNKTRTYTFEKLKERFEYNRVDPYIYSDDNIFQHAPSEEFRNHLWNTWAKEVLKHPLSYLIHRTRNICYAFLSRLSFDKLQLFIEKTFHISFAEHPIIKIIAGTLGFIFLSQILLLVSACFYFYLGLRYCRKSPFAQVLLGLNSLGLLMIGLIFFLSMAGTPRYTYIMPLMVQASHIFALGLYLDLKKGKALGKSRN
ncbi:MAG: hypothetical protein FJX18_05050 [Alphaproteobacteria bacterium]|nr:hypothetical protein [Alphaproteobacteria bacterium]